jgi:hypothetical protein
MERHARSAVGRLRVNVRKDRGAVLLLDRSRFKTQVAADLAVFEFIEDWYDPHQTPELRGRSGG